MSLFERLSQRDRCFVVAEIGANHNGDLDTALRMITVAAETGADAVKLQSFLADHLTAKDSATYALLKRLEVPRAWYPIVSDAAAKAGLLFFSTATNSVTLQWLVEVDAPMYKIGSPNITHIPLIRETAALGKPIIMSTGMASLQEIDEAVQAVFETGNQKLALLHCVSHYPANPAEVNLRFMTTLKGLYDLPVGFSDHTLGIGIAVAAVALGARIIEKHITLDRGADGADHHYALEPGEFGAMVRAIRDVEQALGTHAWRRSPAEEANRAAYHRTLHAACDIAAGDLIKSEMLAVIRPADGLHPRHLSDVVGRRAAKRIPRDAPITWSDV
jgi:N-acetylneuraminate synthase/N,N'-diacetyllegionaminate synthase